MILLDTNVISELIKRDPHPAVRAFVASLPPETVFTSAICEAEIRYGLARMPEGRRRNTLTANVLSFLDICFGNQVLRFDRLCAGAYGEIRHRREAAGRPISLPDAMIAATARAYGIHAIATRNIKDFADCGVPLIDPWLYQ
jgi:predicted nucleic acid-binding protein